MKKNLLLILLLLSLSVKAQETFPVNGVTDNRKLYYAFTNAYLWIDHQTKIEQGTLLIRDGKVEAAGSGILIPPGAVVYNMNGKWIYPSFIDAFTGYGMPDLPKPDRARGPVISSQTKGAYSWNQALKPEAEAHRVFTVNENIAEKYRAAGFGLLFTGSGDGIARGTGAVVNTASGNEQDIIIKERAAAVYSFNKGSSQQDYPTSEMGAIALLRQSFLDAEWYKSENNKNEINISIQSWNDNQDIPQIFDSEYYLQSIRAAHLGNEFGVKYIIKGTGEEYKRIDEIRSSGNSFIIPLKFPEAHDVSDPYDALNMTLEELKHWEMAPANPFLLYQAGVNYALTSSGLKDPTEFIGQLRKAVLYGLPRNAALKALTYTPASLLRIYENSGSLQKGKLANFIITSGDIFEKENFIVENWVRGNRYIIRKTQTTDITGNYNLKAGNVPELTLLISGDPFKLKAEIVDNVDTIKANVAFENSVISLTFEIRKGVHKGWYSLTGYQIFSGKKGLTGTGLAPSAMQINWEAQFLSDRTTTAQQDTAKTEVADWGKIVFPNKAYGFEKIPAAETVLFKNITVWTNEKEGILENYDVLISNGKISKIGKDISATGARVVDGIGKHLTAGIIDEHSHIAVSRNVNECSHAVTAEVRIGDVINPDDINIYRQLSGGVTTSQLLHGSCNPIGGQSAIIKLRWGQAAEKMKFEGAPGFIKFALGENVKQANWGDDFKIRYPQTRMGVEQVYIDAFTRAKEYEAVWKVFNAKTKGAVKPRRDLRLETLVEILNKKRFISCHSYQQGEINMLMKVGDSLGFTVNTFTHILEGYKVADKMKVHGSGASSFSDWWAYKFEVIEAIPHNGPIMHNSGLVVAYNSDDAEMARRLNQEAAKAIMYGGLSEEEALKFVTLNPAKLLRIDHRVGSIRVGKDADLVVWNGPPLSVYSKTLMTFIDGACYYDSARDEQMRTEIERERARIIKKLVAAKAKSGASEAKKPPFRINHLLHCMDEEEDH